MTTLAEGLAEHLSDPFPTSIVRGSDYGLIDPVMIDADIHGWVLSTMSGPLTPEAHERLELARVELANSWHDLPEDARPYYARLIHLADAAIQGCSELPNRPLALMNRLDNLARVDCNGEVAWHRDQAEVALDALAARNCEILGLDLRGFPPSGRVAETHWESLDQVDYPGTNLQKALASLTRSTTIGLDEYPWILVTFKDPSALGPLAYLINEELRKNDPLQPWLTESHWDDNYWAAEARMIAEQLKPGMSRRAVRRVIVDALGSLLGYDKEYESKRLNRAAKAISESIKKTK